MSETIPEIFNDEEIPTILFYHLPKDLFPEYDTLIFFDTETTGLNPSNCNIIELGAVCYSKLQGPEQDWQENGIISNIVSLPEGADISDEDHQKALQVNHITEEDIKNKGIDRKVAFTKFADMINGKTLICAFNTHFDYKFMLSEFSQVAKSNEDFKPCLEKLKSVDVYDALLTSRARVAGVDNSGNHIRHRLENMIRYYNIEGATNSHRALDDVDALIGLTKAFRDELNDLSSAINCFPYYDKYGNPSGVESDRFTYLSGKDIASKYNVLHQFNGEADLNDLYKEERSKSETMYRSDVPDEVKEHISQYLSTELPSYELLYVCRASDHPDDDFLYQVAAYNTKTNEYACWTSWNEQSRGLNYGHYGLKTFPDAKSILDEHYHVSSFDMRSTVHDCMEAANRIGAYVWNDRHADYDNEASFAKDYCNATSDYCDVSVGYVGITDDDIDLRCCFDLVNHTYSRYVGGFEDCVMCVSFEDNETMLNRILGRHNENTMSKVLFSQNEPFVSTDKNGVVICDFPRADSEDYSILNTHIGVMLADCYHKLAYGFSIIDATDSNTEYNIEKLSLADSLYHECSSMANNIKYGMEHIFNNEPDRVAGCKAFLRNMDRWGEYMDNGVFDKGLYEDVKKLRADLLPEFRTPNARDDIDRNED